MRKIISRRKFLNYGIGVGTTFAYMPVLASQENTTPEIDFPIADLHVHLSGQLSIEQAMQVAKDRGVKFGIVEHPGHNYKIKTDQDLKQYIDMLAPHPVYKGIQPVYPKWRKAFSKELLARIEYVLMDAQTLPNPDGTFWRIWRSDTVITNKEKFMDRYVDYFIQILTTEKLNILAAPFYLPRCIAQDFEILWTPKRVQTIIDLAVKHHVAIEISESFRVPNATIVKLAKSAGAKFTFGTNSRHPKIAGRLDYCKVIAKKCDLTKKDMYLPAALSDKEQVY
jgi:histidinol phosphatase-like PHP family hydrolase